MCKYRVVLQYLSSFGQNRQLRNELAEEDPAPVNRQASIDVTVKAKSVLARARRAVEYRL
jgi:hypothetical protein